VCILAGMTTLIGSSTNLLIADTLARLTDSKLAFFSQTVPGLFLAGVGIVYMALMGDRLLPSHASLEDDYAGGAADGRQFIAQIDVTPGHPLVGAKPVAGLFPDLPNITVRLIQRRERVLLPPFDNIALRAGDSIIVAATRQRLTELLSSRAGFLRGALHAEGGAELEEDPGASFEVLEAVVAPGARIIERTIEQSGIHAQTGAIVLGVQRRSRMMRGRLADIRLAAGDVLLIMGSPDSLRELRRLRDLLLLEGSSAEVPDVRRAVYARAIFAGTVVLAATGLTPILHAALLGALAMIAARCLNLRQAARALDLKVFLLIGAAFAMGGALEATGSAEMIAHAVTAAAAPFGPVVLLSAIFLVVVVFTNILSNSATAILFAPIAITAAEQAGADPAPFALTVLFAANCSFVTPIAYQTNLLVMGPGRYHFADFARIGAPLALVIWIAFTLTAPLWFDLSAVRAAVGP
jgi:di/tricarboxylate transporter